MLGGDDESILLEGLEDSASVEKVTARARRARAFACCESRSCERAIERHLAETLAENFYKVSTTYFRALK